MYFIQNGHGIFKRLAILLRPNSFGVPFGGLGQWYVAIQALEMQSTRQKGSHFDLKMWVTDGTKIRPGIPSDWLIFVSNWLDIESQIDSNIFQLLGIPGLIIDSSVTQIFRSKWLLFFVQCTRQNLMRRSWEGIQVGVVISNGRLFCPRDCFLRTFWGYYSVHDLKDDIILYNICIK